MSTENSKLERFDAFMQRALYDSNTGYYSKNVQTVGSAGDFSTTATLSDALGKAIAKSALDWSKQTNSPLHLIEVGGGDGSLASAVISSLPLFKRWRARYHIVDSSGPLTRKQQARDNLKGKVNWHSDVRSALESCRGVAFIFSNELVDAFPVRIFKKSSNYWNELYLNGAEEHFCPCADTLPESSAIERPVNVDEQRIEVHESYRKWMQEWLPSWREGQLLTIDYGDTHPKIYFRMPAGTLRAYSHQQRITGKAIYLNPGKQDITADVNFSDLIAWGTKDGLVTTSLMEQLDYLAPHISDSEVDHFLIHPDGAGSAFKVLLQEKM